MRHSLHLYRIERTVRMGHEAVIDLLPFPHRRTPEAAYNAVSIPAKDLYLSALVAGEGIWQALGGRDPLTAFHGF